MKVVYTIADLQPESGGPPRSVCALARAVADTGEEVEVVAQEYGPGHSAPMLPSGPVTTAFSPCRGFGKKFKWSAGFARVLRERAGLGRKVVIHDNGVWLPSNHAASRVARVMGVPFISSPRGMLSGWSFKFRGLKKRFAWRLYQWSDLRSAKVLHATSEEEAEGFRTMGLLQPVAVIPNGVEAPEKKAESGKQRTQSTRRAEGSGSGAETKIILFLSRIHPKKGLLDLVEAWDIARPAGWRVVIAGGDEEGHLEKVKAESRKRKVESDFEFVGSAEGEGKWDLYRSADLFVLPTMSENFGLVVAEALACGVPVITTRGAPWEGLVRRRCGWWVKIGAEPVAEALREATALNDEERRAMGRRGREWMERDYTWGAVADKMVSVYRWMLGTGEKPAFVN